MSCKTINIYNIYICHIYYLWTECYHSPWENWVTVTLWRFNKEIWQISDVYFIKSAGNNCYGQILTKTVIDINSINRGDVTHFWQKGTFHCIVFFFKSVNFVYEYQRCTKQYQIISFIWYRIYLYIHRYFSSVEIWRSKKNRCQLFCICRISIINIHTEIKNYYTFYLKRWKKYCIIDEKRTLKLIFVPITFKSSKQARELLSIIKLLFECNY